MKRIETRDNEFLEQFRASLRSSFPDALHFKVDYYLGENQGVRGLYFVISSKVGTVFTRIKPLGRSQVVADVEEEFMNEVIDSLVMTGVTFANLKEFESISPERVNHEVLAKSFMHTAPRKIIFLN